MDTHNRPFALSTLVVTTLLSVVTLTGVVGCTNEAEREVARRKSNLHKLGMGYHAYYAKFNVAPADIEELSEFMLEDAPDDEATKEAVRSLRELDIVIFWNGILDSDQDNDQFSLGFEASVPGSGGYMVTGGGFVQLVTAKAFADMPSIPVREPAAKPETDAPAEDDDADRDDESAADSASPTPSKGASSETE